MAELRTGDGRLLPPLLRTELDRLRRRLVLVLELIRELEAERNRAIAATAGNRMTQKITALQHIRGIGANFAAVLVREVFYRSFATRLQLASYVGIVPMPYQSGGMDRDRSISRMGTPRARTTLIQLAWLWLRYQPGSARHVVPRARRGPAGAHGADRPRGGGQKASDRALALRRDRRDPSGRGRHGGGYDVGWQTCHGRKTAGGDEGSASVFVFGGPLPPRFRWVASRRGKASCKRHHGAGPQRDPTACKVMQLLLRNRIAPDPNVLRTRYA